MRDPTPIVGLRGITKRFPGIIACERVDLRVYPGQIHALLDGQPTVMRSPKDAIRLGIAMVLQPFTLIPSLTVAENIALAGPSSHLFRRHKWLAASVQVLAEQYQLAVDPNSHVWQLSVGEQQRVEILKLLHRCARLLILDEPTAVLTPQESAALLQTMRQLAAAGHAVILITHRLVEALSVADRITVLRHGRVVANTVPAAVNQSDLARWMIGHDLAALGEVLAERAGVLNLGVEGMMLVGALAGFIVSQQSGEPSVGVFAAAMAGVLLSGMHAFLNISLHANQVGSGLALMIFGTGLSGLSDNPSSVFQPRGLPLWNPLGTALGAYLFGGVQALQLRLQAIGLAVPTYVLMMTPYALTILALLIASSRKPRGHSSTPSALATAYIRGE